MLLLYKFNNFFTSWMAVLMSMGPEATGAADGTSSPLHKINENHEIMNLFQHTSTSDMMSSLMQDFWKHKVILNINKFWPKQRVITDRLEYKHEQRHCSPYSLFQDARCVCSHIGFEYSDQWHQFHMTVIPNDGISSRWKCEAVNPLMSDPRLSWKPSQVGKNCDLFSEDH